MKQMYKKMIFLLTLALPISVSAQSYTISPSSTVYLTAEYNTLNESAIYLENDVNTKISLSWSLISNNLASGWDFSLCDYGTCYPGIPASGTMDSLDVGDIGFLSIKIDPYTIAGSGYVKMYVYETNDPSNGDTLIWYVTSSPSGVNELSNDLQLNVSPNPSDDVINVSIANAQDGTISIFDAAGRKVISVVTNNELSKTIDISSLAPGAYYLQYISEGAVHTKRFIKK